MTVAPTEMYYFLAKPPFFKICIDLGLLWHTGSPLQAKSDGWGAPYFPKRHPCWTLQHLPAGGGASPGQ